jgi:hypothetical protein
MIALLALLIGMGADWCGCGPATAEAKSLQQSHQSMVMTGQMDSQGHGEDHCKDGTTHPSGDIAATLHAPKAPIASAGKPAPDYHAIIKPVRSGPALKHTNRDALTAHYRAPPLLKSLSPVALRVLMLN